MNINFSAALGYSNMALTTDPQSYTVQAPGAYILKQIGKWTFLLN